MYIQQIDIKRIATELNAMLYDFFAKGGLIIPINRTTFKYRNYLIIYSEDDSVWNVFYLTNIKKHIASTFLKVSAFSICKAHELGSKTSIKEIKKYDTIFERNYTDSLIFKNTINNTTDNLTKDTAICRFEIVHSKAKYAKQKIDNLFYSTLDKYY